LHVDHNHTTVSIKQKIMNKVIKFLKMRVTVNAL